MTQGSCQDAMMKSHRTPVQRPNVTRSEGESLEIKVLKVKSANSLALTQAAGDLSGSLRPPRPPVRPQRSGKLSPRRRDVAFISGECALLLLARCGQHSLSTKIYSGLSYFVN